MIKEPFKDFLYGLLTGLTTTIPGISFGALAMLFNIYEKFINAFSRENIKKSLPFLIPFFVGCGCSIFLFSRLVAHLLAEYDIAMYFGFIGLILGCVPMIYRKAEYSKIKIGNVALFSAALAFMVLVVLMNDNSIGNKAIEEFEGDLPVLLIWIFCAGFASAVAIVIPGLSGSVILLMLGSYEITIGAISTLNIPILLAVGGGIVLGMLAGIKLIKMLIARHREALYSVVLGLVIGSVFIIYPGFEFGPQGVAAIIMAAGFAVISYLFSKKA